MMLVLLVCIAGFPARKNEYGCRGHAIVSGHLAMRELIGLARINSE
jgi:hypothetical protein